MNDKLLHTPEGVRDIYNGECARKNLLQGRLNQIFKLYGYKDIQTPMFEFFDIFNQERGTVSSRDMYKFFDREGNTLVLRPDITPSIARAVAKYFNEETQAMRFSYMGNIFINNSSYQGRMKELTQMGAELVGDDSVAGDAELIALAIDMLLESGLTEFQIDIGHVGFFKALVEAAGMNEETQLELRALIENKNNFGVEDLLSRSNLSDERKNVFLALPELFGSVDVLEKAKSLTKNPEALKAIARLEQIYGIIDHYGFQKYVTIDLGMLTEYDYYTGMIFRGYTYGTGDAIVKGGRYDHLIQQFGKKAAAVGFAIPVDQLLIALSRQNIKLQGEDVTTMVLYHEPSLVEAIGLTNTLRNDKMNTALMMAAPGKTLEDYITYAKNHQINGILYLTTDGMLKSVNVATNEIKESAMPALREGK